MSIKSKKIVKDKIKLMIDLTVLFSYKFKELY